MGKKVDTESVCEFMFEQMKQIKTEILTQMNARFDEQMIAINELKEMIQAKDSSSKQPHIDDDDGFNTFPISELGELKCLNELMLDDDAFNQMVTFCDFNY